MILCKKTQTSSQKMHCVFIYLWNKKWIWDQNKIQIENFDKNGKQAGTGVATLLVVL